MRYTSIPPDTRGVGTPEREIKNDAGEVVGRWDGVDVLRLRFARWCACSGIFSEFPVGGVKASRLPWGLGAKRKDEECSGR